MLWIGRRAYCYPLSQPASSLFLWNWALFSDPPPLVQLGMNIVGLYGVLADSLRSNPPLWTLSYEIWFYVIGGAVAYLFSSRSPSSLALAVIGCSVAVFSVLSARYFLFWFMGGLVVTRLHAPYRRVMALLGAAFTLSGVTLYQLALTSGSFENVVLTPKAIPEFLICAGVTLIVPLVADPNVNARMNFMRRPATFLGAISYSLYLFHYPIQRLPRFRISQSFRDILDRLLHFLGPDSYFLRGRRSLLCSF